MSFAGSFYGMFLGGLSTSHSKFIHKKNIGAFNWPILNFPLDRDTEAIVLDDIYRSSNVAGLIIEPIQCEGGDREARIPFYQELREMCKDKNISFIVDEVQTRTGGTGVINIGI